MKISTSPADNEVAVLAIEGAIDAHTARELDRALKDLLAQGHSRLVLDVSQLSFISSAGLRVIVYADREASGRGGQVRICGLGLQVRRVFEMAALDECLQLFDGCQELLEGW